MPCVGGKSRKLVMKKIPSVMNEEVEWRENKGAIFMECRLEDQKSSLLPIYFGDSELVFV